MIDDRLKQRTGGKSQQPGAVRRLDWREEAHTESESVIVIVIRPEPSMEKNRKDGLLHFPVDRFIAGHNSEQFVTDAYNRSCAPPDCPPRTPDQADEGQEQGGMRPLACVHAWLCASSAL